MQCHDEIIELLTNNRFWARKQLAADPNFFLRLSKQQTPKYLWIGCSDSRVPANEIIGLGPGEVFVHRNVANLVVHSDLNCNAVLEYAVSYLRISHILVVGHYGCGGIRAVSQGLNTGLSAHWLRHAEDVLLKHKRRLTNLNDSALQKALCEFNVIEQVANLCRSNVVLNSWRDGYSLALHGLVYSLEDGLLRTLGPSITGQEGIESAYKQAISLVDA
jgi:carbonic anhydrase